MGFLWLAFPLPSPLSPIPLIFFSRLPRSPSPSLITPATQATSLPPDDLPRKFVTFFPDKIVSIRNDLSTYGDDDHLTIPAACTLLNFVEFNHVTSSEIEKLIASLIPYLPRF